MFKVQNSTLLDRKTKRNLGLKIKNVSESIQKIEQMTGISYPACYVEPVLRVTPSDWSTGSLGVLYARTIPIQSAHGVSILVELSAPIVLYATKATIKIVLAHELMHYIALVKNFSQMDLTTQITSASVFEELYIDSSRAINPTVVFDDKKFARSVVRKTASGLADAKLDEKCKVKWIEKGMPVTQIPIGANQVNLPVESILQTQFDSKVREIIAKIS